MKQNQTICIATWRKHWEELASTSTQIKQSPSNLTRRSYLNIKLLGLVWFLC